MQWDLYEEMKNHTSLPIILKGITTVDDAKKAVEKGVPAIMLSNHGGRQVDYSPSPLEIAFEIHHNAPEIFNQIEVLADSGIRYGDDVVKLLALGVKAVGMGRPYVNFSCSCGD
jgi:L-lactate dehydrogenase (cytochrome)